MQLKSNHGLPDIETGSKVKKNKDEVYPIIVGTNSLGYPQRRNFASLPFKKYTFKKYFDLYKFLDWAYFKTTKRSHYYYLNTHNDFNLNPPPFYHFFNTLSYSTKPWITTFETDLPRWGGRSAKMEQLGIRLVAGTSCKRIIAISESTALHQHACMDKYFPSLKDVVLPKMEVIHPSQSLCIKHYGEKKLDRNHIIFTLIGNDFFRKGGGELLMVFDQLLEKKAPVKLHIVTRFEYGDYASQSTKEDVDKALKIISKYPENIFQYSQIDNTKVLELLNRSHVGLLPTWADTYGYSVLEAQASGCPVITTNVRALPEINNQETGWVVDVPKDSLGDSLTETPGERKMFSNVLREKLFSVINEIINNVDQIERKGKKSLERIEKFHNPAQCANKLEHIYDSILKNN